MAGLLDFVNSPAGIGLLSAMAGGMAGARRGQPINSVGRGLVTGLQGYQGAKDQIRADEENALTKRYKSLQMQELESKIAQHKAMREAATGAYQDASKPAQFSVGGKTFPDQQAAQLSAESMFSLPNGAVPGFLGDAPQEARSMVFNPTGELPQPQPGFTDFSGGQVPQITQQQSPNVRSAMYARLMQAGIPEEAAKYAPKEPKWNVVERYNDQTGMPEKVLMDENNPSDIRPFGGAQADTIVADNLGGSLVYRGSRSATPLGEMQRTESPDSVLSATTARRGQDMSNANAAAARSVAIRGQDKRAASSNRNGVMAGWKYDAGSDEWVSPPSEQFPMGQRSGNKAKTDASKSMAYVISQFRGSKDEKGNPVPGVMGNATTGGPMGAYGMAGRVFDSQDAMRFNNLKEQMSTELRTLFRIPGEGALSDKEQSQYGIQLPDVKYSSETNEAILRDIESRVGIRNNLDANPYDPGQGKPPGAKPPKSANQLPTKPPAGVDAKVWQHMTPAERKLWQK